MVDKHVGQRIKVHRRVTQMIFTMIQMANNNRPCRVRHACFTTMLQENNEKNIQGVPQSKITPLLRCQDEEQKNNNNKKQNKQTKKKKQKKNEQKNMKL